MNKRVSLTQRRDLDKKGVELILGGGSTSTGESVPVGKERPRIEKVTLYVRADQVLGIEEIQLAERQLTGKKPDKSDLVQEALDLLLEKYRQRHKSIAGSTA
ncbi:MAG: hypothetical protein K2Q23_08320 [Bryobacteraceae bacterium]|nr:hypothetical protein [Bryobacteraceae bacterium]